MACKLTAEELADLMRLYKTDPTALAEAIRTRMDPTFSGKVMELWKAGLLNGPQTHIVNFASSGMFQSVRMLEKALSERLNAGLAKTFPNKFTRDRFAGETAAALHGAKDALPNAFDKLATNVGDALRARPEKLDLSDPGKFEHALGAIGGTKGRIVRTPFRLLNAADDFWKDTIRSQELYRQAFRQASKEGKSGDALSARMRDIIEQVQNPKNDTPLTQSIRRAMGETALAETWQTPLGQYGRALAMISRHPLGGIILPFVKTPLRIAEDILARTPYGYWKAFQKFRAIKKSGGSLGEFTDELAKPILGTVVGAAIISMTQGGTVDITGGGPLDYGEQENKRKTGWQPYSLKIGDTYVSYRRFEPLSSVLGIAADMREAKDAKKAGEMAQKLFDTVAENITNQTFLSGLAGAAKAVQDPKRYGAQWLKQLEGSLVPNVVAKTAQAIDPIERETQSTETLYGVPEPMAARIPFLSQQLPAKRTATGEEKERPGGRLAAISPVTVTTEKPEAELEREFDRIGWVPGQPSRKFTIQRSGGKQADLTDEEYRKVQDSYKQAAQEARRVMRDPRYKQLPDTIEEAGGGMSKEKLLQDIYSRAKRGARGRIERSVVTRFRKEQRA